MLHQFIVSERVHEELPFGLSANMSCRKPLHLTTNTLKTMSKVSAKIITLIIVWRKTFKTQYTS